MLHRVALVPLTREKNMRQDRVQAVGCRRFKIIYIISNENYVYSSSKTVAIRLVCFHYDYLISVQYIPTVPLTYGSTQTNISVDKKNQLDVTFCILYLSSNSCSTCFGQPCAHHQELTTA